jgi:hypothetical protein
MPVVSKEINTGEMQTGVIFDPSDPFDPPSWFGPGLASLVLSAITGRPFDVFWLVAQSYSIPFLFSWWILTLGSPLDVWFLLTKLILIPTIGCLIGYVLHATFTWIWTARRKMFAVWWWKGYTTPLHLLISSSLCVIVIVLIFIHEWVWWSVWHWLDLTVFTPIICGILALSTIVIYGANMNVGGVRKEDPEKKYHIKWGFVFHIGCIIVMILAFMGNCFWRFKGDILFSKGEEFWPVMFGYGCAAIWVLAVLVVSVGLRLLSSRNRDGLKLPN